MYIYIYNRYVYIINICVHIAHHFILLRHNPFDLSADREGW